MRNQIAEIRQFSKVLFWSFLPWRHATFKNSLLTKVFTSLCAFLVTFSKFGKSVNLLTETVEPFIYTFLSSKRISYTLHNRFELWYKRQKKLIRPKIETIILQTSRWRVQHDVIPMPSQTWLQNNKKIDLNEIYIHLCKKAFLISHQLFEIGSISKNKSSITLFTLFWQLLLQNRFNYICPYRHKKKPLLRAQIWQKLQFCVISL